MIFPPGSMVMMVNRPVLGADYRALGVCFTHDLIDMVYANLPTPPEAKGVQIVPAQTHHPAGILALILATIHDDTLPEPIRQHRLLEPPIWLREGQRDFSRAKISIRSKAIGPARHRGLGSVNDAQHVT